MVQEPVDRTILQGQQTVQEFRNSMRNSITADTYERRLIHFLKSIDMEPDSFVSLANATPKAAEKLIISYIGNKVLRIKNGDLEASTLRNELKPVKLLLDMNDVVSVNWRKISRYIPISRPYALDRVPTTEEIQNILESCDIRGKALTLVFLSSGIREGAIKDLKISDLEPVTKNGKLVAGKLIVYNGDPARYTALITLEAYNALMKYIEFRQAHHEEIKPNSPLFRNHFNPFRGQDYNDNIVEPMSAAAIRQYYNRLWSSIGVRKGKIKSKFL